MWPGVSAMMNFRFGVAKYRYATSMVMPCSRSARSPSVSSARSVYSSPRSRLVRSTASSWSWKICFESYSRRPMSVLFPSSTDPAVARRSSSISAPSEVALALAVFHGCFREAVVGPGRAAFGDPRRRDLDGDLLRRGRDRLDGGGAAHVADGPEPHRGLEHLFPVVDGQVGPDGHEHPVAAEDLATVRVVDRRQLDGVGGDVLPDVELRPVRQREDAEMLAGAMAAVVQAPQLGPLVLRVPLPELVAVREHALLGASLLLVAATAAEHGVEAVLGDRLEQDRGLEPVARRARAVLDDPSGGDRIGNRGDDEPDSQLGDPAVAEVERLGEVVPRVDVHDRERDRSGRERLLG